MKARINGIDLAYSDEGQGAHIVFLHAFPLNRTMWTPQVEALQNRYRVITIDLRGHGESDAPMWRYTLEQFADDVIALLQHLSITGATFVGLSMGGYVLFSLFRKYPDSVRGLVFADTRAQADTPEGKAARFSMAQIAYKRGTAAIADLMMAKLLSPAALTTRLDLIDQLRGMIIGNQISGIVGDLMAMEERPDSTDLLQKITCPTLVIAGKDDVASPPAEVQFIADQITGAEFACLPRAGHMSNMENPEAFNKALEKFLARIRET